MPGTQIDLDALARDMGFTDTVDMWTTMHDEQLIPRTVIERILGVAEGTLKYRIKQLIPGVKFRPRGVRGQRRWLQRRKHERENSKA